MAAWSAGSYASAAGPLSAKFDCSDVAVLAGITMFTVGFAFFPMITAPVSEVYGRRWLFIGTYVLFEITTIGCALVTNLAGMLLLRFFVGTGASSFSTMVGGLLADCFESSMRGFPLALFSTGTFIGTALGPLASDFIVPRWGYAWLFWMQAILNGAGLIAVAILLPETRMSVLLRREAQRRNALSTEQEEFGESDESQKPLAQLIRTSLLRPFHFLATESIVFWFSLWITFAWSILYLFFVSIPFVFANEHRFSRASRAGIFGGDCSILGISRSHRLSGPEISSLNKPRSPALLVLRSVTTTTDRLVYVRIHGLSALYASSHRYISHNSWNLLNLSRSFQLPL